MRCVTIGNYSNTVAIFFKELNFMHLREQAGFNFLRGDPLDDDSRAVDGFIANNACIF